MMEDLTGMDLYALLQERRAEYLPRIIFMTGGGFTHKARDFLAKETVASIDKPFDPMKIRELVAKPPPRATER
jgi:DNA-binding NtrC family response regulator